MNPTCPTSHSAQASIFILVTLIFLCWKVQILYLLYAQKPTLFKKTLTDIPTTEPLPAIQFSLLLQNMRNTNFTILTI